MNLIKDIGMGESVRLGAEGQGAIGGRGTDGTAPLRFSWFPCRLFKR